MYFKNYKCPVCNREYDSMDQKCPDCGEINNHNVNALKFPHAVSFPYWKQIVLFFIGWLGFQIIGTCLGLIARATSWSDLGKSAFINFLAYVVLVTALSLTVWSGWKKFVPSFKSWKPYVFGLIGFIAIMIFSNVWNSIISVLPINIEDNANQSAVASIVDVYPFFSLIIMGIVGPICEELTYRVGLFSFSRRINRWLAYIITILVFAFIHFDFASIAEWIENGNSLIFINEILNLPFYLFAGLTFSFLYEKFGFASSCTAHIINNSYSIILMLLLPYIQKLIGE